MKNAMAAHTLLLLGVVIALLTAAGFAPETVSSQAMTTPTPAGMPSGEDFGTIQADCGSAPHPEVLRDYAVPVLGSWPLWITTPAGDRWVEVLGSWTKQGEDAVLPGFWTTDVRWLLSKRYPYGFVRLTATNLTGEEALYLSIGDDPPSLTAVFSLEFDNSGAVEWDEYLVFPGQLWASRAGCYRLEVRWDSGTWSQTIPVGEYDPRR